MSSPIVFCVYLASVLFMTGVIWVVQWVHYPLFDGVGSDQFETYEKRHTFRITFVVLPPMVLELITAIWLAWEPPSLMSPAQVYVSTALTLGTWASTFFLSVPEHNRLSNGFDAAAHRRLVLTNGVRTLFWTINSLCLLWVVYGGLRGATGG